LANLQLIVNAPMLLTPTKGAKTSSLQPRFFATTKGARYPSPLVSEHYRPIYVALADHAITELTDRFSNIPGLKTYQQLENVLTSGDVFVNEAVLSLYPELDPGDLAPQLKMFRRTRQVSSLEQATAEMKQLIPAVRAEYSQVCQLIRLLLVSPAASAQAEWSFSALRRLKTWLRTSMSEVRLNSGPSAMSTHCCWTV